MLGSKPEISGRKGWGNQRQVETRELRQQIASINEKILSRKSKTTDITQARVQLGMLMGCPEVTFNHYEVIKINLNCCLDPRWWEIRKNSGQEHAQ